MPAPINLSFELLGPRAGQADGWAHRSITRTFFAGFARNLFLSGGVHGATTLSRPHELDHADWTPSQLTVTANAEDEPDSSALTVERLTDNATNALHYLQRTTGVALENGKAYTFGFFARKSVLGSGIDKVGAYFDLGGGNYAYSCFDIFGSGDARKVANLHITAGALPTITKIHGEVVAFSVGGGSETWCLCSTTILIAGTPTIAPAIILNPNTSGALTTYVGTSQALDAWGAFLIEDGIDGEDSFERAWGNDNYLFTMTLGVHTILFALPIFGQVFPTFSKNEEDFEELWGNSPYITSFTGTGATFDPVPENFEDFEESWAAGLLFLVPTFVTIHQDNKLFTPTAHGLLNGMRILLTSTVTLPTGLLPNQEYFVVNATASNLQVSLTSGGSVIDFTDDGFGIHRLVRTIPTPAQDFFINDPFEDLLWSFSHGLPSGSLVTLISDGVLPAPLLPNTQYIVLDSDGDSFFLLSTSFGNPLINITDFGTGVHYIERVSFTTQTDAEPQEDFEDNWNLGLLITRTFTASASTDVFLIGNHGCQIGTMVQFFPTQSAGNTLPNPIQEDTPYWVVGPVNLTQFKVAATPDGTAINLTTDSVGTVFMRRYFPSSTTYTVNTGTEELNVTAHPFLIGTRLQVESTGDSLPSPLLTAPASYYIVAKTTNAFQISATRNGGVINLTTTGVGTQFIARMFMNFYDHTPDTFGQPASDAEDFETTRRTRQYTVDFTTDTFTSNAHGYSTNDVIFFTNDGGAVPGGINVTTPYFVIGAAANTFQISLTQGGGAVNILDNGSGLQYFNGDPKRYWIEFNDNI